MENQRTAFSFEVVIFKFFSYRHSDGICSHNMKGNKKRMYIDKSEIIWSFIKTLDKADLEMTSTEEEDHPHATLEEFKKLYSHNSNYFESELNRWQAPIFEYSSISNKKELIEA